MSRLATCSCGTCPKCKRRIYMAEWLRRPGNAEKTRQRARRYRCENIEVVRARDRARGFRDYDHQKTLARKATRILVRPEGCEDCGGRSPHAHHKDYSKPLEVDWLCSSCHGKRHRILV